MQLAEMWGRKVHQGFMRWYANIFSEYQTFHCPSMLADRPFLVNALWSIQFLSVLRKYQVIGQASFFLLFIGYHHLTNLVWLRHPSSRLTTESYEDSLVTISQQTSYDSGILRQDYITIRGLPERIETGGPYYRIGPDCAGNSWFQCIRYGYSHLELWKEWQTLYNSLFICLFYSSYFIFSNWLFCS